MCVRRFESHMDIFDLGSLSVWCNRRRRLGYCQVQEYFLPCYVLLEWRLKMECYAFMGGWGEAFETGNGSEANSAKKKRLHNSKRMPTSNRP